MEALLIVYVAGVTFAYALVFRSSRGLERFFRNRGMSEDDAHRAAQFSTIVFALLWFVFAPIATWYWIRSSWAEAKVRWAGRRTKQDLRKYLLDPASPLPKDFPSALPPELAQKNIHHLCRVYQLTTAWIYAQTAGTEPADQDGTIAERRLWSSSIEHALDALDTLQFFRPGAILVTTPDGQRQFAALPKPLEIYDIDWTVTKEPFCSMPPDTRHDAVRRMVVWVNDHLGGRT